MNTAAGLYTHSEAVKNICNTLSMHIAVNNANPDMQMALLAVHQTVEILDTTQMDSQIVECLTSFTRTIIHTINVLEQTRVTEFKNECGRFQSSIIGHLSAYGVLAEIIKSSEERFFEMVKTPSFDRAVQKPQMDGDSYHRKDKVTMTSYQNTTFIKDGSKTNQNLTLNEDSAEVRYRSVTENGDSAEVPYRSVTENEHGAEATLRNVNIAAQQYVKIAVMHENRASLDVTSNDGGKITASKGVSQMTLSNHARTNIEGMTVLPWISFVLFIMAHRWVL